MQTVFEGLALLRKLERLEEENAQLKKSVPRIDISSNAMGSWWLRLGGASLASDHIYIPLRCSRHALEDLVLARLDMRDEWPMVTISHRTGSRLIHIYFPTISFDIYPAAARVLLADLEALKNIADDSVHEVDAFLSKAREIIDLAQRC